MNPYKHQILGALKMTQQPLIANFSDPGTGKTLTCILAIEHEREKGKTLVLAPKSILIPAWANDFRTWAPHVKTAVAFASNRKKAFLEEADVYITNHDAVNWLIKHQDFLEGFYRLIIDESEVFKHRNSVRSKNMLALCKLFESRVIMSGTPMSNGLRDMWHQVFLLDYGARLGKSFHRYEVEVAIPIQVGPKRNMLKWKDKEGADEHVAALLHDLTIRELFEECQDIPPNVMRFHQLEMTKSHATAYKELRDRAILEFEEGKVRAVNKAVLRQKLMQALSGAVYRTDQEYEVLDETRYEYTIQVASTRPNSVIAFLWQHQKDLLIKYAEKYGLTYAVIDGKVGDKRRAEAVERYQAGDFDIMLLQPQAGGHGLTLTRGVCTIWASPTDRASQFKQVNSRIYRTGQTKKTETICIFAKGTVEEKAYKQMIDKYDNMIDFLDLAYEEARGNGSNN